MVMLLPAIRNDDGGRRHAAIQRFGPPVKVGTRWVGPSGSPAVWCGLGRHCNSRRILGEGAEGGPRLRRSRDPVTPGERWPTHLSAIPFCQGLRKAVR